MLSHPGRSSTGFSLLEVLIALVIFSVGLLGIVTLQAVAKKATFDSVQRMTAAILANDMFERMRSNPAVLDQYLGIYGATPLPEPATNCEAETCEPVELAAYDLWQFHQVISSGLESSENGGTGGISVPTFCIAGPTGGGSGNYEVTIAWRGRTQYTSRPAHLCGTGRYGSGEESRRLLTFITFLDAGDS